MFIGPARSTLTEAALWLMQYPDIALAVVREICT